MLTKLLLYLPEILAIAPALYLGFLIARQDIRERKASNRLTHPLIGLGFSVQVLQVAYSKTATWLELGANLGAALGRLTGV
ncbi:MAG: hypothetical protein WDA75_08625 [Candidatus Latescibacterota bacterium]|jgi:hypothetical protein